MIGTALQLREITMKSISALDFCGIIVLLTKLQEQGVISDSEKKRIESRIASEQKFDSFFLTNCIAI